MKDHIGLLTVEFGAQIPDCLGTSICFDSSEDVIWSEQRKRPARTLMALAPPFSMGLMGNGLSILPE